MESFAKYFCKFFQTLFSPVVDGNKMINLFWSKAKRNSDSKQEKEKKATLQHRIWLRIPRKKKKYNTKNRTRAHTTASQRFHCAVWLPDNSCSAAYCMQHAQTSRNYTARDANERSCPITSGRARTFKTQYFTAKRKHYKCGYTVTGSWDCCVTVVMALQNRETCTETQSESWHFDHWEFCGTLVSICLPTATRANM